MTITELILNFRLGLVGLIPRVDAIDIPWRPGEAYDAWDHLAQAVYDALVVEPISASLLQEEQDKFTLHKYNFELEAFSRTSLIEVLPADPGGIIRVFLSLNTETEPFDSINWQSMDTNGRAHRDTSQVSPLEGTRFAFRKVNALGVQWEAGVENIVIPSGYSDRPAL